MQETWNQRKRCDKKIKWRRIKKN